MARRGRQNASSERGEPAIANGGVDATGSGDSGGSGFSFGDVPAVDPAGIGSAVDGNGGSGDGDTTGSDSAGTRPRRKYTKRATSKGARVPVDVLSAVLFSSHAMLAGITRVPEFMVSQDESTELAKALSTVSQFYDVQVAEKSLAWINLGMVAGSIYGTRLVAIAARRRHAKVVEAATTPTPPPQAVAPEPPTEWAPGMNGMGPMDFN